MMMSRKAIGSVVVVAGAVFVRRAAAVSKIAAVSKMMLESRVSAGRAGNGVSRFSGSRVALIKAANRSGRAT